MEHLRYPHILLRLLPYLHRLLLQEGCLLGAILDGANLADANLCDALDTRAQPAGARVDLRLGEVHAGERDQKTQHGGGVQRRLRGGRGIGAGRGRIPPGGARAGVDHAGPDRLCPGQLPGQNPGPWS